MIKVTYLDEAKEKALEWFTQRNEARGQYPKRISVKWFLRDMLSNGSKIYTATYKWESVEIVQDAYNCYVNLDAPVNITTYSVKVAV